MPFIRLETNVKVEDPRAFVTEFTHVCSEILGKPPAVFAVNYSYSESLAWNGTFDPALVLSVHSLGNINAEDNKRYSKSFFDYFEKKLGVPGDRGYIKFADDGIENFGYKGTTVSVLRAQAES